MIADYSQKVQAIMALMLFLLICTVYIVLSICFMIRTMLKVRLAKLHKKLMAMLAYVLTAVAGLFYLIGDNISTIVLEYEDKLNCKKECQRVIGDIAIAMLVMAALIFRLKPQLITKLKELTKPQLITKLEELTKAQLITKLKELTGKEPKWSYWRVTAQSVSLIIELDVWFSAVAAKPLDSPMYCPIHELSLAWVLYIVCLILFLIFLILAAAPAVTETVRRKLKKVILIKTGVTLGIIWLCSGITLLSDNYQPLGCVFGCDQVMDNTKYNTTCLKETHIGTRIGLLILDNVMLITIVVMLIGHWAKKVQQGSNALPPVPPCELQTDYSLYHTTET